MQSNANRVNGNDRPIGRLSGPSAGANSQFDPWILWVTFRRNWLWAVPVGMVLASLAAFGVFKSFVPVYRASHLLEANSQWVVFKDVIPVIEDIAATEKPLFFNSIILDPVLADPALRKAPSLADPEYAEVSLRENLKVTSGGNRRHLVVSYEDSDGVAAATVCNAVVDSYLRQRDAFDQARMVKVERGLEPEIQRWQQEVEQRHHRVQKLSETLVGFAPGQKIAALENESNMTLMAELRSRISDLRVKIAIADASRVSAAGEAEFVPPVEAAVIPSAVVERHVPSEQEILNAINQDAKVSEALSRVAHYKAILLELEDSDIVRIRREYYEEMQGKRDEWTANLETLKAGARERVVAMLNERADAEYERQKIAAKARIESLKEGFEAQRKSKIEAARVEWQRELQKRYADEKKEYEALATQLDVLQKQYDDERSRLEQFGGASADLQLAIDEKQIAMDVLGKLKIRAAAIRTEKQQGGSVQTLAAATPPRIPLESVPTKKLIAVSGGAFCIPFLLGLLWELRVQRVTDSAAVDRSQSLAPVVGEIAQLPSGARNGRGRRIFEESVDALRANLFLSLDTKHTRSIAVVSSMSGEGKSSVASQLALSIAKATDQTVLLVDADLRYPDQHEIFGLEMGPGLSGVLSQTATLEEAVDTSLGSLLHVLPAGRLDRSPHRLISESSMRDFVDRALEKYSFVVIDTAPVLSASESLAVASSVDSTLLCVMRDVSRMDNVNRSMRRLDASGATIAGTVFSGVTAGQYAYRYGSYHYAIAGETDA
ncbi:Exopolysaccharide synthesis protein [Rhodopirellula maiorica SM1]|uniref:Exopolysaccharide synthesis protein n=1 Tax=Rhodopirellula maiorica SM1 TaxID=1265738 RepID=M5RUI3_9BACT|nr:tyrosine-protein kinase domain-containing protein [Rhodopirellula maiorica]EMI22955.1 Exopolysaccharide synthesis protein [Rhodopirellula maiorica SM1]